VGEYRLSSSLETTATHPPIHPSPSSLPASLYIDVVANTGKYIYFVAPTPKNARENTAGFGHPQRQRALFRGAVKGQP